MVSAIVPATCRDRFLAISRISDTRLHRHQGSPRQPTYGMQIDRRRLQLELGHRKLGKPERRSSLLIVLRSIPRPPLHLFPAGATRSFLSRRDTQCMRIAARALRPCPAFTPDEVVAWSSVSAVRDAESVGDTQSYRLAPLCRRGAAYERDARRQPARRVLHPRIVPSSADSSSSRIAGFGTSEDHD